MPHPRGGLTKAQRLGGLTIGKLLEVAEQDDLAIPVIHVTKYGLKSGLKLMPDRLGSRSEPRVTQLCGQIQ